MKRLIFALSLVLGLGMSPLLGQVYHINVSGTIDLGLPAYIERVIGVAEKNNAKAIVLEVNTFGGRVDAATQIKDLLFDTDLQTLAFVNKRAISAGALISLSCRKIGMVEGSSIGAATVVTQDMEKASEKQISYFRAEMGATAERNGRNREIAEGMVDETLTVEGLSEEGKLITLTAKDAVEWQMADLIAPNVHAFLDSMGLGDEEVIYSEETFAEDLVRFFTDPMVSSLLIGLGFLVIVFWSPDGILGLWDRWRESRGKDPLLDRGGEGP
ncbi:MAG TPA: hypothetical protein PLG66_12865 [Calditrichia bacterium]|nr:hypothetical protein [Calditrichia bacterium]